MRVAFLINVDWFFKSHRLALAKWLIDKGHEVAVLCAVTDSKEAIERAGVRLFPINVSRRGSNPIAEWRSVREYRRALREFGADVVHCSTPKGVLLGGLALRRFPRLGKLFLISGLGFAHTSSPKARLVRPIVQKLYKTSLANSSSATVFQNPEDLEDFVRLGMVRRVSAHLIRGSGVNTEQFHPHLKRGEPPIVVLGSRIIWDKGIREFVDVARRAKARGIVARYVIVGEPDQGNPNPVPMEYLQELQRDGVVEWWGKRDDMHVVLGEASVAMLPTRYKEGLPKVLLEAAACGCPIIASDIPGCREIVRHGTNGFLVDPLEIEKQVDLLQVLLSDQVLAARMGQCSRELAVQEFSEEVVFSQYLRLIEELGSASSTAS